MRAAAVAECILCVVIVYVALAQAINVALHAQVKPNDKEKIVGSVITTDGLRQAFLSRTYIHNVTTFYPSGYDEYFDVEWDYVVIEGWFPSIHHFLLLTRNHFPSVKIVFFCLDPTYPGLNQILSLDFDGIMTNSDSVFRTLQQKGIPGSKHLLAADTNTMKPLPEISQSITSIYVGASGHMLIVKPYLLDMLLSAKKFGLHIYGTGWGAVPELSDIWKGTLPRYQLAQAYSSAKIVLASTIKSQDDYGMVNNRIFEALACGATVLSEYSETLEKEFGDLIFFHNESVPVQVQISRILSFSQEFLMSHRTKATEFVKKYHTWMHRIIDMENFLFNLPSSSHSIAGANAVSKRPSARRVLVVTSERLLNNLDYKIVVHHFLLPYLRSQGMHVVEILESMLPEYNATEYHIVFAICAAFDTVDTWVQDLPFPVYVNADADNQLDVSHSTSSAILQRRAVYFFGFDGKRLSDCGKSIAQYKKCSDFTRYDVIFYRTAYELDDLRKFFPGQNFGDRVQHLMGVDLPMKDKDKQEVESIDRFDVFICFWQHRHLCDMEQQQNDFVSHQIRFAEQFKGARQLKKILLLIGGASISEWITLNNPAAVNISELSAVYHWASEVHRQDILRDIVAHAFMIYAYLPRTEPSASQLASRLSEAIDLSGMMTLLSANQALLQQVETVDDTLTLLTAAAVSLARVHLSDYQHHWLTVAQRESANTWTYHDHVRLMLRNGFDRLFGLPPTRATLQLKSIEMRWTENTQQWTPEGNVARDILTDPKLQYYLRHELRRPFLLFRAVTQHAVIGKDVLICLNNENISLPSASNSTSYHSGVHVVERDEREALLCVMRPFAYFLIVDGRPLHSTHKPASLWWMLRGTMFSNYVQRQSLSLNFPSIHGEDASTVSLEELQEDSGKLIPRWMLPSPNDNILIYVYRSPHT